MTESFEDLELGDLRLLCDKYGVEYRRNMGKVQLIQALENDGVRPQDESHVEPIAEVVITPVEEALVEQEEEILIRMVRRNPRYETAGFKFLKDHPFQVVPVSVADHLIENVGGFRVASPAEAKDFYN